jgi:hypothetical protein
MRVEDMVFAVQCPNPNCKKYMLVEERDCMNAVVCLLCKTPFQVEAEPPAHLVRQVSEMKKLEED